MSWKDELNEDTLLNYYGLLFCVAAADKTIVKSEIELIYNTIDPSQLSKKGHEKLDHFLVTQPSYEDAIKSLSTHGKEVKYGVYLSCLEVSLADEVIVDLEAELLSVIRSKFNISQAQHDEMISFINEVKKLKTRGKNDKYAEDAFKQAASGLSAVGVPIAAVYFSGSVIGLSAAGVTSGLAALGLGLGMVPGIGVAVLIGVGVFYGIKKIFYSKEESERQKQEELEKRKAQAIISNLQSTINVLLQEQEKLKEMANESKANKEAIIELEKRIEYLKLILKKNSNILAA